MDGIPGYLLHRFLSRLLGREAADSCIRSTCAGLLELPRLRSVTQANFRRIHNFVHGREPSETELADLRVEMARLLAQDLLSKYAALKDPAGFEAPTELELLPRLREVLRKGRGAVLVTPHFGNTTVLFLGLAKAGFDLHVMVNQAPRSAEDALAASGLRLHLADLGTGAKYYLEALKRNELVLLLSDIDFFPGNRTLPFFGAPFNPPHGPARLAMAAGAAILPVYALWDGTRHRLACDSAIQTEGADQEAVEMAILRSMERFIGGHPGHWLVYHDPWDLEASARENRRQLRQLRLRRSVEEAWTRLTSRLRRARI